MQQLRKLELDVITNVCCQVTRLCEEPARISQKRHSTYRFDLNCLRRDNHTKGVWNKNFTYTSIIYIRGVCEIIVPKKMLRVKLYFTYLNNLCPVEAW